MSISSADQRRARWLRLLHQWHWISSALCLVGMLLFAVTGITLNHAGQIESRPRVDSRRAVLPSELLAQVDAARPAAAGRKPPFRAPLPSPLSAWLRSQWQVDAAAGDAEWSADEVYLSMPRPGGDAWLRVALDGGEVEYESTDRGWISYLNDLHKGRNAGVAWSWFIDLFGVAALVFSATGFFILQLHARNRSMTWPVVGFGLLLPVLLALLFAH